MVIRIHPKRLEQLCKLLHLSKKLQNKKSPRHSEIETPDSIEELPQHEASVYRSCIGILLYLSSDLPQCQYVIRYLSTCASKPTQKAMTILKHLVDYMAGHPEESVSLKWKGIHSGLLRDYECEEPVLEIFSDADWAADRTSRRSVSGSAIFYGGCLIYSSSRTQKIVSLSSAESETYAAAPAVMDAILIRTCWVLQIRILMYLFLNLISCKGSSITSWCWSFETSQLSHVVFAGFGESETFATESCFGNNQPSRHLNQEAQCCQAGMMFLFSIWSCLRSQLVGSEDPGRILRHLSSTNTSHTGRVSQLQLLVSALSLLTVQLQGCSESVDAMSSDTPDVPSMFLATWLGLLGAYVFWLAQPSKSSRRVAENPNFEDGETCADEICPDKQHVSCHK